MTVRIGVVGTGFGARVVAPVFAETEGCEVVDVVSARDDAAVAALCARRDVDLVSVHSPPFLHVAHVRAAVDAGHAVMCDKPFGRNEAEAAEMLRVAERGGCGAPPELRAPLHADARAAPRPGVGGCRGHPRARPVDARQRQLPRPPAPPRLVVPARARWRVDRRVGFPRGRHAALDVRRDHGRAGRLPDHDPGTPRPRRPAATV